ncbi:hypothetical protein H2200_000367 [Cladophialophora chaetospira]|uniref:Uncharacterized protein n=1 Tax=Cladophialophora chaetospira TaxID=386627 RepID=A0AA38XNA0_9EURO|nr:hypothetical protein H2200_000367 [Cladophialophora chaetospira]
MSSNNTSDLPNTGSTYPHTKTDAISFSNDSPFGSSGNQQAATANTTTSPSEVRRGSEIAAQPTNFSDNANPLQSHHRPSLSLDSQGGVESLSGDQSIGRHSIAQNAPGKLGERGENVLGAIGFGGSTVERPKEDQGIGEKIAEFLGV